MRQQATPTREVSFSASRALGTQTLPPAMLDLYPSAAAGRRLEADLDLRSVSLVDAKVPLIPR